MIVKRLFNVLLIMAAATFFVGCSSRKSTTTDSTGRPALEGPKWQLVELDGKEVPATVNGKMPFLQLLQAEGRYAATGGCNGIGGEYNLKPGGGISFERGMSTMMACEDMHVEHGLRQVFEQADRYEVGANGLILKKGADVTLAKFALVKEELSSLAGSWELDYIEDSALAFDSLYASRKPTINFDVATKKVTGNSSCNSFFGTFEADGSTIKFGPLGSTKMACPGSGEQVFLKNLERVTSFDVQEGTLTLIQDDVVVMRLHRN